MTTKLYCIPCTWSPEEKIIVQGMAICSDPNTPVTFLYPSGEAYEGKEIWTYKLHHYRPWTMLEVDQ
jgi:hypothetical protein